MFYSTADRTVYTLVLLPIPLLPCFHEWLLVCRASGMWGFSFYVCLQITSGRIKLPRFSEQNSLLHSSDYPVAQQVKNKSVTLSE